jgi:deoxycytidylate deaminase
MSVLFPRIEEPELFFGFVSPIGTSINGTIEQFKKIFKTNGYEVHEIKVTDVFKRLNAYVTVDADMPLKTSPFHDRCNSYIRYGNKVRTELKDDSILAGLAIQQIMEIRNASSETSHRDFERNVFLIHQFKRPEEIALLRSVYGRLFFQVSIYSDRASRIDYICRKIAHDLHEADHEKFESGALQLIKTDEDESNIPHGQRVGEIFHDADIIVKLNEEKAPPKAQVERFCELIFSSNSYTPTKIEYGMFTATSAALRTADLSRQVGAAIFSQHGEVLSVGCNEVPKAGGGTYWPDDAPLDAREFCLGADSNDARKSELLSELLEKLDIEENKLSEEKKTALKKMGIMDALEYGRIVHAEMNAITDAARSRGALRDSIIYCTTFPCHMCAKHIVASGIKEVYFLEPYPKSLTARLHTDSVEIEKKDRGQYREFDSVKFTHFYGVTPRRYSDLFARGKRKDVLGKFQLYVHGRKRPYIDIKVPFYVDFEQIVLGHVKDKAGE